MSIVQDNTYDNSENVAINAPKDQYAIASSGTEAELDSQIKYFKYLKLRSEIETDGTKKIKVGEDDVSISELMPAQSEYDVERLRVLRLLNRLGVDDPLVLQIQRDIGTDSLWECASAYANYSLARSRGERLFAVLNGKTDSGSIYLDLIDKNSTKVTAAKKAIFTGDFVNSAKSRKYRDEGVIGTGTA